MQKCQPEILQIGNNMMFIVWAIKPITEIQLEVAQCNNHAVFVSSLWQTDKTFLYCGSTAL